MSLNPRKDKTSVGKYKNSVGKSSQWNPRKKKKPSEQIQEYLDRIKSGASQGIGGALSGVMPGGGVANAPMARPSTPNQYIVGQVQNQSSAVASGVSGGLSGALKSPKPPEDTKPPEYVLTLPEQTPPQAGAGSQPQGPTYTLTLPTPEEQALALEQARKQAHIAAFADQMAAMDAEFWRIAQNPGSMLGANESPYYSLYMKQYQQRARDRETNAYTRANEGTGGYGSSFATMAGDQAYRETMQEFDELAPTLIKSKSERMAEILQEREMLKAMGDRINAESNTLTLEDGTTVEVTDAARELYAGYLDSFTQGTGYDTLKTAMINGGASEADADQAIAMFKKLSGATVADQISALEESPTLSGAAEAYLAASQKGTLDRDAAKISAGAKAAVEASLKNAGDDEEAMNTALAEAAQAVKDGYMSESDYVSIITADIHADIQNMESGDEKISDRKKRKRVAQSIEGIIAQYESGNLSDDGYQKALIAMKPYLEKYFGIKNGISMGDAMSIASMNKGEINAIMEAAKEIDKVSKKAKIAKERRG